MAQQRAAINLGDLALALTELQPKSAREQEVILRCLGLKIDPVKPDEHSHSHRGAWPKSQPKDVNNHLQSPSQTEHSPAMPLAPEKQPEVVGAALPITIKALGQVEVAPTTISEVDELPFQEEKIISLKRESLFPDRTSRGLLSAATAQLTPSTTLDVTSLIEAVIEKKPLKSLPMLPQLTNSNGCQLMLDFSGALIPWREDMRDLIAQCHSLLGESNCPVYEFDYDPNEAIRWAESGEQSWKAVVNKPVLLATDFGITRYSKTSLRPPFSIWRDFALHCHKQRVPIIALTPIDRQRAPKLFNKLEKLMVVIQWHHQTRAADIRRLLMQQRGSL